jgi:septum formation protein
MAAHRPLLLASQSPRRRQILSLLSIPFKVVEPIGVDETPMRGESARQLVRRLALLKARSVLKLYPRHTILAADTVVVRNGRTYGKPKDRKEAEAMLGALLGRGHEVYTGVALIAGKKESVRVELTKVFFGRPKKHELEAYLNSAEPYDKAGAYAIQGTAGAWIKKWEGDYFNVMGLPIQWVRLRLSKLID